MAGPPFLALTKSHVLFKKIQSLVLVIREIPFVALSSSVYAWWDHSVPKPVNQSSMLPSGDKSKFQRKANIRSSTQEAKLYPPRLKEVPAVSTNVRLKEENTRVSSDSCWYSHQFCGQLFKKNFM